MCVSSKGRARAGKGGQGERGQRGWLGYSTCSRLGLASQLYGSGSGTPWADTSEMLAQRSAGQKTSPIGQAGRQQGMARLKDCGRDVLDIHSACSHG